MIAYLIIGIVMAQMEVRQLTAAQQEGHIVEQALIRVIYVVAQIAYPAIVHIIIGIAQIIAREQLRAVIPPKLYLVITVL